MGPNDGTKNANTKGTSGNTPLNMTGAEHPPEPLHGCYFRGVEFPRAQPQALRAGPGLRKHSQSVPVDRANVTPSVAGDPQGELGSSLGAQARQGLPHHAHWPPGDSETSVRCTAHISVGE